MENEHKTAILTLKKNNDLYRHIEGNNKFKNLRTGVEWEIEDEKASEIFTISYNATMMINKYPIMEELILKLKLKLES